MKEEKKAKRIKDIGKTERRISPEELAKALGASEIIPVDDIEEARALYLKRQRKNNKDDRSI